MTQKKIWLLIACSLLGLLAVGILGYYLFRKRTSAASISSREALLIHSEHCGHCVKMMPVWQKIKKSGKLNVAMRELSVVRDTVPEEYGRIRAFPTILSLRQGRPVTEHVGAVVDQGALEQLLIQLTRH